MGSRSLIRPSLRDLAMDLRTRSRLFVVAAVISFAEAALAPKGSDPGPWAAAVLGILLLRRAIVAAPQPLVALLSGYVLTLVLLAGDHRVINVNSPVWIAVIVAAGVAFGFWERLERLWRRHRPR